MKVATRTEGTTMMDMDIRTTIKISQTWFQNYQKNRRKKQNGARYLKSQQRQETKKKSEKLAKEGDSMLFDSDQETSIGKQNCPSILM